ncbi:helix-turn-helix transcriptional regulator [Rhizobium sp. FY34]|uniref:helix-turn-helix domain-containing protein n=1 Tax=Rhizobium sp. FY34 TaxID=2562309 RepID=UPI0010C0CE00|nr:helix-turn-helix transcriptional regulator [Rhizobium sp. FY34]
MGELLAKPESEPKTLLGGRIRDVRRALGDPDRTEFADSLGISKNTLAYYERGERTPDAMTLAIYNERFGININWLATGKGDMFAPGHGNMATLQIDPDLMERLHDRVSAIFGEVGQKPPQRRIAREVAYLYNELAKVVRDMGDKEMLDAALPMLTLEFKRKLERAAAEPGTGKRSAS